MSVDFASVFRVLTTLFGLTAIAAVVGVVLTGWSDGLLLLALVSALLSLAFRLAARARGGPSQDKVSLVGSWVIVVVLGSALVLVLLFIQAISGGLG